MFYTMAEVTFLTIFQMFVSFIMFCEGLPLTIPAVQNGLETQRTDVYDNVIFKPPKLANIYLKLLQKDTKNIYNDDYFKTFLTYLKNDREKSSWHNRRLELVDTDVGDERQSFQTTPRNRNNVLLNSLLASNNLILKNNYRLSNGEERDILREKLNNSAVDTFLKTHRINKRSFYNHIPNYLFDSPLELDFTYTHVTRCSYSDRFYCLNGGRCVYVGALDIKTCRCPAGLTGLRCEMIDENYLLALLTNSIFS